MKPRCMILAVLALTILSPAALAQPAPGEFGVYFDFSPGAQRATYVTPFTPFQWYVIAGDLEGDVLGFEFRLEIDPEILVIDRSFRDILLPIVGWENDNWIVSTLTCEQGLAPYRMVTYTAMLTAPAQDVLICLGPSEPSSLIPPQPNWTDCAGVLHDLEYAPSPCAGGVPDPCSILNPTVECPPLAGAEQSWGMVKALY